MNGLFSTSANSQFNQDISNWDVSSVTDMGGMFYFASVFNQDISNWNVSSVTEMANMFNGASAFNQPLEDWNVDSVTNCNNFCEDNPNWTLSKPNFTNCESGCD